MHVDEKNVRECNGCARSPIARIIVSAKKKNLVNDPVSQKKKYLQDPEAAKTPIKAILQSNLKLKILKSMWYAVPNGDQSFNLSSFL